MSRRLGDDPLNRARSERAKAAQAAAPAASEGGGQAATVVGATSSARASYNDVFFQRREAGAPARPVVTTSPEAPEITEISEIPEIREATATAAGQGGVESNHVPSPEPEVATAHTSIIEEAVAKLSAAAPTMVTVEASATVPVAPSAPEASTPEKSGGFLKRLFGKFK